MPPNNTTAFEQYRPLLFSIAYRMLGSAMEAEDVVQEAYLRFQTAQGDIENPRAYLSTIVTRLCLDYLKSARTQREEYYGEWLPEPLMTTVGAAPTPEEIIADQESISVAFLVLLENLSPIQRAVYVLREVFEYPYAEIAQVLKRSEATCRQHFRQAKAYLLQRKPRFSPPVDQQERLITGFMNAIASGDVGALTGILAEDVVLQADGGGKVASALRPMHGAATVARFLTGIFRKAPADVRTELNEINGQLALIIWEGETLSSVFNFVWDDGRISNLLIVRNPDKLRYLHGQQIND